MHEDLMRCIEHLERVPLHGLLLRDVQLNINSSNNLSSGNTRDA